MFPKSSVRVDDDQEKHNEKPTIVIPHEKCMCSPSSYTAFPVIELRMHSLQNDDLTWYTVRKRRIITLVLAHQWSEERKVE